MLRTDDDLSPALQPLQVAAAALPEYRISELIAARFIPKAPRPLTQHLFEPVMGVELVIERRHLDIAA